MIKNSFLLIFSILLWLTACTMATPTPEPTQAVVVDVVEATKTTASSTITPTTIPTASQTPPPTSTPTSEPSPTPQQTNTPEPPTPIVPTLIPTIDVSEEMSWAGDVQAIYEFVGTQIAWSPGYEEFVYIADSEEGYSQVIFAEVINFQPINLTPAETKFNYINILWHPLGEYFFLAAEPYNTETYSGGINSWKFERVNHNLDYLGLGLWTKILNIR